MQQVALLLASSDLVELSVEQVDVVSGGCKVVDDRRDSDPSNDCLRPLDAKGGLQWVDDY